MLNKRNALERLIYRSLACDVSWADRELDPASFLTRVVLNRFVGVRETGIDSSSIKALSFKPYFATLQHSDFYGGNIALLKRVSDRDMMQR